MSMSPQALLLDTNILLAALIDPDRLPEETQTRLRDPANSVFFSAASIWEIAIKRSLGREDFSFLPEDIHHLAQETGFTELPIRSDHCYLITDLPWRHRDPFDRLLVCQAISLPAYLLTSDTFLKKYSELVQVVGMK